jgi:hypothetical protein
VELREGSEEVVERRVGRKSVLVAREDIVVWKKDTTQSISPDAFVFPKPTNRNALTQSGSGRITGPAKGILYCISCNLTLSV